MWESQIQIPALPNSEWSGIKKLCSESSRALNVLPFYPPQEHALTLDPSPMSSKGDPHCGGDILREAVQLQTFPDNSHGAVGRKTCAPQHSSPPNVGPPTCPHLHLTDPNLVESLLRGLGDREVKGVGKVEMMVSQSWLSLLLHGKSTPARFPPALDRGGTF